MNNIKRNFDNEDNHPIVDSALAPPQSTTSTQAAKKRRQEYFETLEQKIEQNKDTAPRQQVQYLSFSYPFQILFISFSYPFHTLFIFYSYTFHILSIFFSYYFHILFIFYSYRFYIINVFFEGKTSRCYNHIKTLSKIETNWFFNTTND